MSAAPIKPTDIRCKDGSVFTVARKCGSITVFAAFLDDLRTTSGLARFSTFHEPGDARAEHTGMPVDVVRAYAKAHGGVAHAGAEALALLKALAEKPTDSPAPAPAAPAEEPVPQAPLSEARGASVARGAPPSATPRAPDTATEHPPALVLDELTTAVIDARRDVADFEGPVVWRWGRLPSDRDPTEEALWRRITHGSGMGSRLGMAEHSRYSEHPLCEEALRLRASLLATAEDALDQKRARRAAELRSHWESNRARPAGPAS